MKKMTLFVLLLLSPFTLALGLGNAVVHSAIGEKLLLEIPLLGSEELSKEEILIRIASPRDYQNLNVAYEAFHHSLRFTMVSSRQGSTTLVVTSTQPVTEPYLHFVLQLTTPDKTLLKDIALLLDTPQL